MPLIAQGNNDDSSFELAPDWGRENWKYWQLVEAVESGSLPMLLESWLVTGEGRDLVEDDLRVRYTASLLKDLLESGGEAWTRDSRLFVRWPNWSGEEGRRAAARALEQAKDIRPLRREELTRIRPLFAPDIDGDRFGRVLEEAVFTLRSVEESHPCGIRYQEAFSAALRYWTMPYRGRTGRMRRFVLTAEHPLLGATPVVAGLIELGDEAPFCTWRDDLLGLSYSSFRTWLNQQESQVGHMAAERLRELRGFVRPTSYGLDLSSQPAQEIVLAQREHEAKSGGRSRVLDGEQGELKDRKRIAYALRLARGEVGLIELLRGGGGTGVERNLKAGVRGLHDMILPRLHMEVTVCGAVPPFSTGLGGKLMVAFFSHPDVLDAPRTIEGELLNWSFDVEALSPHLPTHGLLAVTTKGLYQGHAAIYNRAELPGAGSRLRLRHLANTRGTTTTLLSSRTVELARALLEATTGPDPSTSVSNLYGSGGAKRHRVIEWATNRVGLPSGVAIAGIRRPVYGALLVSNPTEVSWLGAEPVWLVERGNPPAAFSHRAAELWRSRWLRNAKRRVADYMMMPSLIRYLEERSST